MYKRQGLVCIGFALELLILEGVCVNGVPLVLGIVPSLLQYLFPIERLAVLNGNSLGNIGTRIGELLFYLGELRGGLLVLRMV